MDKAALLGTRLFYWEQGCSIGDKAAVLGKGSSVGDKVTV